MTVMDDKPITQEELQELLETRTGQSAIIQLVLSMQHELHHTLREVESRIQWTRRDAGRVVEWAREQVKYAADSGNDNG